MEKMMKGIPNFYPRGSGIVVTGNFRYTAEMCDLKTGVETEAEANALSCGIAELDGEPVRFSASGGKLMQTALRSGAREVLFENERLTVRLVLADHWLFFMVDDEPSGALGSEQYNLQLYRRDLLTGETLTLFHVNDSVTLRYADSGKAVFLMGHQRDRMGFVREPFYRYTLMPDGNYTISDEPCNEEWRGDTADAFALYEQTGECSTGTLRSITYTILLQVNEIPMPSEDSLG